MKDLDFKDLSSEELKKIEGGISYKALAGAFIVVVDAVTGFMDGWNKRMEEERLKN